MVGNAAVAALLVVGSVIALALVLAIPAIHLRTGPAMSRGVLGDRADAMFDLVARAPTRKDGSVDTRQLVWPTGVTRRERYQIISELVDRDWLERRAHVGLSGMPAFLRMTGVGLAEWGRREASRRERRSQEPNPTTVTYLSFGSVKPRFGMAEHDGVVAGPSEQRLRELYVAIRSDAESIPRRGLRSRALDCANRIEGVVGDADARTRWAAVDQAGELVAQDSGGFELTQMVLKRLLG